MGALIAVVLIPGPLELGDLTLDAATLLFAVAAILVGTQLVLFYAVAKIAAVAAGLLPPSARFKRMNAAPHRRPASAWSAAASFVVGFLIAAVGAAALDGDRLRRPRRERQYAARGAGHAGMAGGVQCVTTGFLIGLAETTAKRMASRPAEATPLPEPEKKPATEQRRRSDAA